MEKEELCPYASSCNFYQGKIEDSNRPRFFILNVFCRGGERGWTGCQRYKTYNTGQEPEEDLLPAGTRAAEVLSADNSKQTGE